MESKWLKQCDGFEDKRLVLSWSIYHAITQTYTILELRKNIVLLLLLSRHWNLKVYLSLSDSLRHTLLLQL